MNLAQLKDKAQGLGISPQEAKAHGPLNKIATWEAAIRQAEALNAEAQEENRQAAVARAYQSASAPVTVPIALGLAVGTVLVRGVHSMLPSKN